MAKIFQKAGKPWWGALVPIYNSYLLLKVAGLSGWWLLGLSVPVINLFVFAFVFHKLAESFGKGIGYTLGLIFVSPIFFPLLAFGGARHQSNAV